MHLVYKKYLALQFGKKSSLQFRFKVWSLLKQLKIHVTCDVTVEYFGIKIGWKRKSQKNMKSH